MFLKIWEDSQTFKSHSKYSELKKNEPILLHLTKNTFTSHCLSYGIDLPILWLSSKGPVITEKPKNNQRNYSNLSSTIFTTKIYAFHTAAYSENTLAHLNLSLNITVIKKVLMYILLKLTVRVDVLLLLCIRGKSRITVKTVKTTNKEVQSNFFSSITFCVFLQDWINCQLVWNVHCSMNVMCMALDP